MRSRIPCRTKSADNFIPAGDASFPSLFCYAQACFVMLIFGLVNLAGLFVFAIDLCLQDSKFKIRRFSSI